MHFVEECDDNDKVVWTDLLTCSRLRRLLNLTICGFMNTFPSSLIKCANISQKKKKIGKFVTLLEKFLKIEDLMQCRHTCETDRWGQRPQRKVGHTVRAVYEPDRHGHNERKIQKIIKWFALA